MSVPRPRAVVAALAAAAAFLPVAAPAQAGIGPDYVSSDNIELVERIKTVGDGVGATIVGDYMYVTSTKSLSVFDIKTDPEHPIEVGLSTMQVEWENEEVPTNGKILAISSTANCPDPTKANVTEGVVGTNSTGCLTLYDVSDPSTVKRLTSVAGAGQHTSACIYECTWFYGSTGAITDARDPANAKLAGDWRTAFGEEFFKNSCHHMREIQPGIVLASCQPTVLLSLRAEDGGSPLKPVVIGTGVNEDARFIHSSRWPRKGRDKFMISGGETNASPQCDDTVGAFMVWDASTIRDNGAGFQKGGSFKLLDEVRPSNGQYVDGHSPVNGLGCTVHWFTEHPQFRDGGAVALAEYENGTRLLQITPAGKIVEQGFFLPLGGSTSAPHFHPNGKVIYAIDYGRGIDVLRYTGPSYAPDASGTVTPEPGTTPGTEGAGAVMTSDAAPCANAAGFRSVGATRSGTGVRFAVRRRQSRRFSVEIFQQSSGRTLLDNRLRARFGGRSGGLRWNGRDRRGLPVTDGTYFVRFRMKLANGKVDTRRLTLVRRGGRFRRGPDFYQRVDCGFFSSLKLSSSVFGGPRNAPLGVAYTLARGADSVTVEAFDGQRLVKRLRGATRRGKAVRLSLPAKLVARGRLLTVRITTRSPSPVSVTLYARRI